MRFPLSAASAVTALLLAVLGAAPLARAATAEPPSQTVTELADWALSAGDNQGLPFIVIDKRAAEVFVFDADGELRGAAPALLGLARGDDSAPGVGDRELSQIAPEERTTPAGRFVAAFGRDEDGKEVFWIDYGDAISMHPVIVGEPGEHRLRRLKSPTPKDNRITFGCINVPPAFYQKVVRATFGKIRGVVYILPEEKPLQEVFPGVPTEQAALAAAAEGASQ